MPDDDTADRAGADVMDACDATARIQTLRHDGTRGIGPNLEEGAALSLAATTLAAEFDTR
jgi:hypothetical protein